MFFDATQVIVLVLVLVRVLGICRMRCRREVVRFSLFISMLPRMNDFWISIGYIFFIFYLLMNWGKGGSIRSLNCENTIPSISKMRIVWGNWLVGHAFSSSDLGPETHLIHSY